jgi:DNA-binding XRE family transcriptional regulator
MKLPTIRAVRVVGHTTVEITWSTRKTMRVDLAGPIRRYKALARLQTRARFARAAIGEWGHSLTWGDDLDIGADTLYRLAQEQAGITVPATEFAAWRARHGLSLAAAADVLGLSRRTVAYYERGQKPIPRVVGLALKGYDAAQAA